MTDENGGTTVTVAVLCMAIVALGMVTLPVLYQALVRLAMALFRVVTLS